MFNFRQTSIGSIFVLGKCAGRNQRKTKQRDEKEMEREGLGALIWTLWLRLVAISVERSFCFIRRYLQLLEWSWRNPGVSLVSLKEVRFALFIEVKTTFSLRNPGCFNGEEVLSNFLNFWNFWNSRNAFNLSFWKISKEHCTIL